MKGLTCGISLVAGAISGAGAAVIIGFTWGGWVTASDAKTMAEQSTNTGVAQALVPVCVLEAKEEPEQLQALKEVHDFRRDDFVIKAGWVDNVREEHQVAVAEGCAATAVAGMK